MEVEHIYSAMQLIWKEYFLILAVLVLIKRDIVTFQTVVTVAITAEIIFCYGYCYFRQIHSHIETYILKWLFEKAGHARLVWLFLKKLVCLTADLLPRACHSL